MEKIWDALLHQPITGPMDAPAVSRLCRGAIREALASRRTDGVCRCFVQDVWNPYLRHTKHAPRVRALFLLVFHCLCHGTHLPEEATDGSIAWHLTCENNGRTFALVSKVTGTLHGLSNSLRAVIRHLPAGASVTRAKHMFWCDVGLAYPYLAPGQVIQGLNDSETVKGAGRKRVRETAQHRAATPLPVTAPCDIQQMRTDRDSIIDTVMELMSI